VSCPVAQQVPGYWETLLGIDTRTGGVGTVSCGNLGESTEKHDVATLIDPALKRMILEFEQVANQRGQRMQQEPDET